MFGQTNLIPASSFVPSAKSFTANLAQAAATYDLCTASGGDVLIQVDSVAIYTAVAGATFTSVSIQTNQTTPVILLTSVEGAVALLTGGKNIARNIGGLGFPAFILKSGQKIQYTIVGSTGTGSLTVGIGFQPLTAGATLV